ncbi:MAG TPA: bifunctional metallophosphatase/5'-nucleotidase [Sphingomicrobium sp.]|nr:bifunctional metallophosphatase/5'-nucleotidase [Sphingomicrobium sp.]
MLKVWPVPLLFTLAACAAVPVAPPAAPPTVVPSAPVEVQILAFNDLHGNLEPPKLTVRSRDSSGKDVWVPAGGVAYLAGALELLRKGRPHSITVSAGDLIGGSPLTSAMFLDEPTIVAMNQLGLELNGVGNHEFDRGSVELQRMRAGGCEKHTSREPCALDKAFTGARFEFLAANVLTANGSTLFPGTAIKQFGPVRVGFIGMTLKETGVLVTPSGAAGLTFAEEASTANALVPQLKAEGADAIVLLLHQGAYTKSDWNDPTCPGLSGDVLPILDKLDPAIELVISGHTHWAYRCELPMADGRTRLLTSAGRYGTMLTDIRLTFNGVTQALESKQAALTVVQGEPFESPRGPAALDTAFPVYPADPAIKALVDRYAAAARVEGERVVARLAGTVSETEDSDLATRGGELIADSQLGWTRPKERGGAQIAFMNNSGVRGDLVPRDDGTITYGQMFALQPFGNNIIVMTLTGAQLKRLLEEQFLDPKQPGMLMPSAGFSFTYDVRRPAGERIVAMSFNGKPVDPNGRYRVATNSFLAAGGDNFTVLTEGTDRFDAGLDLDALEAFLKTNPPLPTGGRVKSLHIVRDPTAG